MAAAGNELPRRLGQGALIFEAEAISAVAAALFSGRNGQSPVAGQDSRSRWLTDGRARLMR